MLQKKEKYQRKKEKNGWLKEIQKNNVMNQESNKQNLKIIKKFYLKLRKKCSKNLNKN